MRLNPFFALCLFALLLGLVFPEPASAKVSLSTMFSDHMVLQRDVQLRFWGTGAPGEKVTVSLAGQKATTTTSAKGNWRVELEDPIAAGGPYDLVVSGENTVKFSDVLIGDVWLCAGQSNMVYTVGSLPKPQEVLAEAKDPEVRLFYVKRDMSETPKTNVSGSWQRLSPEVLNKFSAIAYLFAREVKSKVKVPIGLIDCAVGGTPIDAWMSKKLLEKDSHYAKIFQERIERKERGEERKLNSLEGMGFMNGNPINTNFIRGEGCCTIFNAMLAPILPLNMKGILWYQGESDLGLDAKFRKFFPAMVEDWRARMKQRAEVPFIYVQLPRSTFLVNDLGEEAWPLLREAQKSALVQPNTYMVATIDSGEPDNIHPNNKPLVAHRLAQVALSKVYGEPIECFGPTYESNLAVGSAVEVTLKHLGKGLVHKGKTVDGFSLVDMSGRVFEATAEIVGNNKIKVYSPNVRRPLEVLYDWGSVPKGNLYNSENLPAVPFRVDVWLGNK